MSVLDKPATRTSQGKADGKRLSTTKTATPATPKKNLVQTLPLEPSQYSKRTYIMLVCCLALVVLIVGVAIAIVMTEVRDASGASPTLQIQEQQLATVGVEETPTEELGSPPQQFE